jgi:hypothetical protein
MLLSPIFYWPCGFAYSTQSGVDGFALHFATKAWNAFCSGESLNSWLQAANPATNATAAKAATNFFMFISL